MKAHINKVSLQPYVAKLIDGFVSSVLWSEYPLVHCKFKSKFCNFKLLLTE